MEAIIFAAGLGTRLQPLTNDRPKALVTVEGHTLLEINIENLIRQGADHIVINVHHHSDMMRRFIADYHCPIPLTISDESDLLLDTGGGLRKMSRNHLLYTDGPYLLYNVDVLSHIDLHAMLAQHNASGNMATLATSIRNTDRQLLFDSDNLLCGWHNRRTDEYRWSRTITTTPTELAYSGIAVISSAFLSLISKEESDVFSITTALLNYASDNRIGCFPHPSADWLDVGKPETLAKAAEFLHHFNS